jgi:hypothetical protein
MSPLSNPSALVLIEILPDTLGADRWHFAPVRMTVGGITLRYREQEIWKVPYVTPIPGSKFATWTYFRQPRIIAGQ